MKKTILTFALFITLGLIFTSCNETKKSEAKEVTNTSKSSEIAMAEYQCPMKCEGDKIYQEQGSCPKCNMDLKEVKKDTDNDTSNHNEDHDESHDNDNDN